MKILIAGAGKLGAALTRQLASEDYDLTLVDQKQNLLEALMEQYDVMAVMGNCATKDALIRAGVKEADMLIALTGEDEVNLLCCMTAHALNPNLHTIARIRNPEYTDQIYEMRDVFALSLTVNPEKQAAVEIERLLNYPAFLKRDTFAKGRVEIVELKVEPESRLCDVSLREIYDIIKCKVLVCAVLRDREAVIPDGKFVLRSGDRIFVTAPTDNLKVFLKSLGIITKKVKSAVLCGGGKTSYYLASQLQKSGIGVKIIEKDYDRCMLLSAQLAGVSIINGDASDQALLESENIFESDAVVSLTDLDELNMIISLYSNDREVQKVITKISHVDRMPLLNRLSIGSIICPKELCCNTIVRYVRAVQAQAGAAVAIHSIADGLAEALEFVVDEDTLFVNEPLKNLRLKNNVLIACITHDLVTEIPDGNSSFELGDTIIIVTSSEKVIHQLNDIFI